MLLLLSRGANAVARSGSFLTALSSLRLLRSRRCSRRTALRSEVACRSPPPPPPGRVCCVNRSPRRASQIEVGLRAAGGASLKVCASSARTPTSLTRTHRGHVAAAALDALDANGGSESADGGGECADGIGECADGGGEEAEGGAEPPALLPLPPGASPPAARRRAAATSSSTLGSAFASCVSLRRSSSGTTSALKSTRLAPLASASARAGKGRGGLR